MYKEIQQMQAGCFPECGDDPFMISVPVMMVRVVSLNAGMIRHYCNWQI